MDKAIPATSKYPDKPITLIVPFGVGGGTDLVARLLEKRALEYLGQPLVIVNKPGGAGTIGWNEVAGSSDGYTLGMTGVEIILQPLYGQTKYHYPTALDPLAQIAELSIVMAVKDDQPWKNLDELIQYAKKHPEEIKFGHGGMGTTGHVTGEMLAKSADIHLEQVPFQGSAEATASFLGGHIQVLFTNPASVKEHVKNGTVRILAVASEHRLKDPVFANAPTFREQGLDVVCSSWHGIAAPKDLPVEVKNKLAKGFEAIINDPEFQKNIENLGFEFSYLGPKKSQEKWLTENQKLSKTVQETGILDKIKAQKK
jgi:tripartite-type tricarboxylate transporter receptor subunit TctC